VGDVNYYYALAGFVLFLNPPIKEKSMIITCLTENACPTDRKDLIAEKGLSLHIQHEDRSILFDTGVKGAIIDNAENLGVDLSSVDMAVISHHHYDHGGGLPLFLEANSKAPIYLKSRRDEKYYFRFLGIFKHYVGLDDRLFAKYSGRFVFVDQFTEISPGVFIITDIGTSHPLPGGNRLLFSKKGDTWKLDDFEHELILVIQEKDGLVVFTGCAHRGILNMLDTVVRKFGGIPIKSVIGGFHQILLPVFDTMAASETEEERLGESILSYSADKVYTGHCTGQKAYRILKRVMGDELSYIGTGSVIEI
jgi:7,8-dihydropterin-6-yl-methyl-4-(beta-D-ribofuranosyl)aminobenzene 5'-phosphate synthase